MTVAAAIRARDPSALPSRRDEAWRWTDLRALIREVPAPSQRLETAPPAGPFDGLASDTHVVANGGEAAVHLQAGGEAVVALRFVSRGDGSHVANVEITVGEGARLTLLESYEGEGRHLAHAALTIRVLEGGRLERIVLAADDPLGVSVSQAHVTLAPGAKFAQTVVTDGARRQRLETQVAHPGGQAEVRLDGLYLVAEQRHADVTTIVEHAAPDGETDQLIKGVVSDHGRAVFQGRIVVAPGADRTDARMGHHALLLSDRAEVDAKPELEIYADDVSCTHGNTVGALDENVLFYARQRGLPEVEARALLTEAFVGEVIERIGHEGARDRLRAWVPARLRT